MEESVKDNFSVNIAGDLGEVVLDMNNFQYSEMSVKLINGSIVVVEAKHSERPDKEYGSISRHFLHRYRLPSNIDPGSLSSDLSDRGVLTITAQKKKQQYRAKYSHFAKLVMEDLILDDYSHPDPLLFYTVTRIIGRDVELFEHGCACEGSCSINSYCSCLRSGTNYFRSGNHLILLESKFGDLPVYECHEKCRCFNQVTSVWKEGLTSGIRNSISLCGNRCVQFGPVEGLEVFQAGVKGLGLRSRKDILKGTFICEYAGEVIERDEARARLRKVDSSGGMNYVFTLTEFFGEGCSSLTCVDPAVVGNIGRYINHSCDPNAVIVPVRISNTIPLLSIFASRDIPAGEEIAFDYSGDSDGTVTKPCLCGSINCRKWLPHQE